MSTFKKTKVVMLSTNEKAVIGFLTQKGKERGNLVNFDSPMPNILDSENQHLYFLSDEEIKEGDWIYNHEREPSILKCVGKGSLRGYKKIIATTDKSLIINSIYGVDSFDTSFFSGSGKSEIVKLPQMFNLPQPSQSFIEKFVEEYNKGNVITEVMVEYEKYIGKNYVGEFTTEKDFDYKLKVNSKDNTITIRKAKDSWSREEVIELLHKRMEYTFGGDYDKSTTDKWIEENL